jgi:hypothetical protein
MLCQVIFKDGSCRRGKILLLNKKNLTLQHHSSSLQHYININYNMQEVDKIKFIPSAPKDLARRILDEYKNNDSKGEDRRT